MSIDLQDILHQVEQNDITTARNMIQAYLKENPKEEQGWVVAFNVFHKKENKIYCLDRILALNPTNTTAAALLKKMQDPMASTISIQTQAKPVYKKKANPIPSSEKKDTKQRIQASSQQKKERIKPTNPNTQHLSDYTPSPSQRKPLSPKERLLRENSADLSSKSKTIRKTEAPVPEEEIISGQQKEYSFFDEEPSPLHNHLEEQIRGDKSLLLQKALKKNDTALIRQLFKEEAEVIAIGLEELLVRQLRFKHPANPKLRTHLRTDFDQAKFLLQTHDPQDRKKATKILQRIWVEDIDNPGLRAWMAFLQLQLGNFQEALQLLESVLRLKDPRFNDFALWNLAALAFREKADQLAFHLILLLLEENRQPKFLEMAIALAIKRREVDLFFSLVPHIWHLKYHPLAIYLAANYEDLAPLNNFSEVYLKQSDWQPLAPSHRFEQASEYKKTIGQAIVSRSIQRLTAWLRARIEISKIYVPDYLALIDVLEKEAGNMEGAFEVLLQRLEIRKLTDTQKEIACRDLIEFCVRANREDFKWIAFDTIQYSHGHPTMLKNIEQWGFLPEANREALQQKIVDLPRGYTKDKLPERLDLLEQHLAGVAPYQEVETPPTVVPKKPTTNTTHPTKIPEYALFIDHENIIRSLAEIRKAFGYPIPANPKKQFALDLAKLVIAIEQHIKRKLTYKAAVSFWNRVPEKEFQYVYISQGFATAQPLAIKKDNAVDFQLVEEIHRFWRTTAVSSDKHLQQIVILTGDGDFSAVALSAQRAGVDVQVWGGRKGFGEKFRSLLGEGAFVLLEDVFAPKLAYG